MDVERAVAVLHRAAGVTRADQGGNLLTCGECGGDVHPKTIGLSMDSAAPALHLIELSSRHRVNELYVCGACGKRTPAPVVNRQLRGIALGKYGDAAWRAQWYPAVLSEAQREIAEARTVYAWCQDSRFRELVEQAVRQPHDRDLRWYLYRLAERAVEFVGRRALLAPMLGHPPRPDAPQLSELRDAARRFGQLYDDAKRRPNRLPWSMRNRDLTTLQNRLWELLAEPDWRGADPQALWEYAALATDWETSPSWAMRSRWSLMATAVAQHGLILDRDHAGQPRIRVVPLVRRDHG
ncbi:hypothetical protein [Amycolatopsis magusensis]|uniref:hypothetical protein n=1 Tax=Amycolatopsis magusensis TaxID=882444 RepID=UPI0024A92C38|nr:hypothetical protein [Amycolatopsis magusensis]MDI5975468.1 hypothetical protein [Amycolatopsis magusensis]